MFIRFCARGTGSNILKKKCLQEVLSQSRGSGLLRHAVKRQQQVRSWATGSDRGRATASNRGRATSCNRGRESARDRGRATACNRGRATARDSNRATAHERSWARAHDKDRPHKAIDQTKEGFKATRGAFELKRSIQIYRHWKQERIQFEKCAQFKTDSNHPNIKHDIKWQRKRKRRPMKRQQKAPCWKRRWR